MFAVRLDDAAPAQRVEQSLDGVANGRDAALALVAPPGDDQHLACAIDLLLPEPNVDAGRGRVDCRQRVTQVQRALVAEPCFVECAMQVGQSGATRRALHAEMYLRVDRRQATCRRPGFDVTMRPNPG